MLLPMLLPIKPIDTASLPSALTPNTVGRAARFTSRFGAMVSKTVSPCFIVFKSKIGWAISGSREHLKLSQLIIAF